MQKIIFSSQQNGKESVHTEDNDNVIRLMNFCDFGEPYNKKQNIPNIHKYA